MQSAVFLGYSCYFSPDSVLCQSVNRHVYVYNGYGSSKSHVLRMVEQLKDLLDPSYVIDTIEADAVKTGTWEEDAALLVMPGGFDLGFIKSLGDEGAEMIRKYVREGGSYLGQGAGAYYACDRIEFYLAGPDEVVGDRPLKFYPGRCSGPVYGPYNYNDYSGARPLILCFPAVLCQSVYRHVYVYNGYGSSKSHVLRMVEQLKDLLDPSYVIDTIEADAVKTGTWEEDAALFVMPGGFDLGFIESLGDKGAEMIRKYVREGGSYLGQGAGAYYACDRIEFDLAGPDEVVGDRPLKFYPGRCSGPVYGPYNYNDYSGARAAHIDFQFISPTTGEKGESIDMRAYYNGGNTFHVDNRTTSCITLGSYTEKVNNPAIVKCNTYDGVAVLTGVHLQFGSMHLDSDDEFLSVIKDQLQSYESSRIRVYDSILHHLGLTASDLKR